MRNKLIERIMDEEGWTSITSISFNEREEVWIVKYKDGTKDEFDFFSQLLLFYRSEKGD